MTSQTGVAKLSVPVVGDPVNVPGDMLALAQSAEWSMRPRFPTTAARDAAITSAYRAKDPTGLNGEGLKCYVAGVGNQEWDTNSWVPDGGPRIASDRTFNGSLLAPSATQVSITNVHNQLCSTYRSRSCHINAGNINLSGTAGDLWRIELGIDGTIWTTVQGVHDASGGPGQIYTGTVSRQFPLSASTTHRLTAYLSRPAGTGTTTLLNINVVVTDDGPA